MRRFAGHVDASGQSRQSSEELTYRLWLSQMAGLGVRYLPSRATKAVVFFLVNQLGLQVLAVSHSAAPQRNVGGYCLLLQRANDVRRAIAAIGGRFTES